MHGRGFMAREDASAYRGEMTLDASFGDYGRNDNPSLSAQADGITFTFEFATPDDARQMAERLLDLARKAEVKQGQRGPEYRARLAREEAMTELQSIVKRFETAMGVENPVEPITVITTAFKA